MKPTGIYKSAKPYTRWWWFCVELKEQDIRCQLDWLKKNGFGGVEIAFVYPLKDRKPGPPWLSKEWSEKVAFAKKHADSIGLGCDFTLGSLWPFGGSIVSEKDASKSFSGPSSQRIRSSWESPLEVHVLDHLNRGALERYSARMGEALAEALRGSPSALFCDSLELEMEQLWADGFDAKFERRYGYSIREHMAELDERPDVRYDYRNLLAETILTEFYGPYTEACHRLNAFSRVQCHGSLSDLVSTYAAADVPESEAILFDPEFSVIPASAAALRGRPVVSAETFTCLYGWVSRPGPGPFQKREQVADMKLLADAMFANGVNFILWHGMPYNPEGGANEFYATVHVGPDAGFVDEIPAFNGYMEKVSDAMRLGKTYSDVAVYIPLEDAWMADKLPEDLRKPSALYHWEMHYARTPGELKGYRPLWVSGRFLKDADFTSGTLSCGDAKFSSLYVDVEWLDAESLRNIVRLAKKGLPVCLKRTPRRPGRNKSASYEKDLAELAALRNVSQDFGKIAVKPPLVEGEDVPDFWCRVDGDEHVLFFAHPKSRNLRYPMAYGHSLMDGKVERDVTITVGAKAARVRLVFEPYQSLLCKVRDGKATPVDIAFVPKTPARV